MEMGGEIFKNLQSGAPHNSVPKSNSAPLTGSHIFILLSKVIP